MSRLALEPDIISLANDLGLGRASPFMGAHDETASAHPL